MKVLLIVFAVLLLLLTLLSTFGGSIRPGEPFTQQYKAANANEYFYDGTNTQKDILPMPTTMPTLMPSEQYVDLPKLPQQLTNFATAINKPKHENFTIEPFEKEDNDSMFATF